MTHTRPTLSLGMIVKNEESHMKRLLPTLKPLFDEIVICDTGSTDGTLKVLKEHDVKVVHFDWVNDFSQARQYCMDHCTMDYFMWLDADDEIVNVDEFIRWRDKTMGAADFWLINYDYAQDKSGKSLCNFIRERVVKNNGMFEWKYPVHEGLMLKDEGRRVYSQRCATWEIRHVRTEEDIKADKNRNLELFRDYERKGKLDARLSFYYGKELYDVGETKEAAKYLMSAAQDETTAITDRLLAIQYCAQSAYLSEAYTQAEQLSLNGVQLAPNRAEMWCILADCRLKKNDIRGAMIYYSAARECQPENLGNAIFTTEASYFQYPTFQLVQCYMNLGQVEKAKEEYEKLDEANKANLKEAIENFDRMSVIREGLPEVNEVVISTPPGGAVTEWDEKALETRGLGGSETAAVEVAKWLRRDHGIPVKIFNMRKEYALAESGVEYIPVQELGNYFQRYKPKFHIAWRHSVKLSAAPMFTWSHDLQTPGADQMKFDKILCLSDFHKNYMHDTQNVDLDKIELFRNGIDPELWNRDKVEKKPFKVVFSSSPDRGLERCIDVCKLVRDKGHPIEFHCFYGLDNMRKMGANEWADRIQEKIDENSDFVHYHGNVDKNTLIHHMLESAVWLYPADFIETYCITVLEALASGAYPMVRNMGALPNTLESAAPKDMYWITDVNCETKDEIEYWADHLEKAILEKRWEKVKLDIEKHSWRKVAGDLVHLMEKEGVSFGNTE